MDVKLQNFKYMLQFENLSTTGRNIVENYLSDSIFNFNKKKQLVASLYMATGKLNPKVVDILKSYLINLNETFSEANIHVLEKEYKSVIRYCYEKKEPDMGFDIRGDNHPLLIPKSLMILCDEILDIRPESDIFLPYAGVAQLAFRHPNCKYEGFELNPELWAFSQIYLDSYEISGNIKHSRSLADALPAGKQYDYVFSFPPFLMGQEGKDVIDNLYHLATKSLKKNGTMCCILPISFCTASSGWFDIRKILWDYRNEYSAAVISLPRMLFPHTSVETCLSILHRDGRGKVLLMDATSEQFCSRYDVASDKEFVLKPQSILETITGEHHDERHVWEGLTSDLIGDVNLLPARYLIKQHLPYIKRGEKLVPLRELIEVVQTERNSYKEKNCPLLGTKELSSNYLNCDISHDMIPMRPNHGFRILTGNCLLAGFIGGKFKVGRTIGLTPSTGVALRQEIIPFKLKSAIVSEEFILRSIMSDNIAQQGKMMNTGVAITRIKKQDFLDLLIVVPSLEEQGSICKTDTKQSLTDADTKQKKTDDEFRRDMHMKKHAIGQTIFNLNNWWKTLQRARKEGNGIVDDNALIGNTHKVTVKEIFKNIQQTIDQLQQQISKFDRGNGLVTKDISLTTFIESYISKHKSPIFKFLYDAVPHHHSMFVDLEEVYDEKGNIIGMTGGRELEDVTIEQANFAPEALTIIFDNIVSNACCHGFAGREEEADRNIIKIELSTEGTDHIITISNDGNSVSEDVTEDYVFTYSKSTQNGKSHYGIGGYEVKRLMQEFDGDAEFISQPEDKFPISYRLIFHNTGIVQLDFDTEE